MSAYEKKPVREYGDSDDSNSHMPLLPSLSSGDSEINVHFRSQAENLSDSEDESSKSGSSKSSANNTDDESSKSSQSSGLRSWHFESVPSSKSAKKSSRKCAKRKNENKDIDENAVKKKKKMENGEGSQTVISSAAQKMMVCYRKLLKDIPRVYTSDFELLCCRKIWVTKAAVWVSTVKEEKPLSKYRSRKVEEV